MKKYTKKSLFFMLVGLVFCASASYKESPLYEIMLRAGQYPSVCIRLQIMNIVDSDADAIVNAANEGCLGGSGIDGDITEMSQGNGEEALGRAMKIARVQLPGAPRRCPTGQARITMSGLLKPKRGIKYIIHAVAPVAAEYPDRGQFRLNQAYENIFETIQLMNSAVIAQTGVAVSLAGPVVYHVKNEGPILSVAIPSLGTGIFGCNLAMGADAAIFQAMQYIKKCEQSALKEIRFVFWSPGSVIGNSRYNDCMKQILLYKKLLNAFGFQEST